MSNERTHGIAPFFLDWLRERTCRVGSALTGDAPTWGEIADRHGADAAGLLYVLISVGHGQRIFNASTDDVLSLLSMSRSRFNQIVAVLVQRKIIAVTTWESGEVTWEVLRVPQA